MTRLLLVGLLLRDFEYLFFAAFAIARATLLVTYLRVALPALYAALFIIAFLYLRTILAAYGTAIPALRRAKAFIL